MNFFYNNKRNFIVFFVLIIIGLAIALPLILIDKDKFTDDGDIEIWTTWSEKDKSYHNFNKTFIEPFNDKYDANVRMVTVAPGNNSSIGFTVKQKLDSGSKIPNILMGKPSDGSLYLNNNSNHSIYSLDEILSDSEYSELFNSLIKVNDLNSKKNIYPYAPFLYSGENLYLNSQLFFEFLGDINNLNSMYKVEENFMNEIKKSSGVYISTSQMKFKNGYYNEVKEYLNQLDINDDYVLSYYELLGSYESIFTLGNIFVDYYELEDVPYLENENVNKITKKPNFISIDNDFYNFMYSTFNLSNNDYKNWITNDENSYNIFDSQISQNSIDDFYKEISDNSDLFWFTTEGIKSTVPFSNSQVVMFTGSNYNSKYLSSEDKNNIQYDEFLILPAPTKFKNELLDYNFIYSKALIPFKFNQDSSLEENKTTKQFINYFYSNLDFEYFASTGYIPSLDNDTLEEYLDYLKIDLNSNIQTNKSESLARSLSITTQSIIETNKQGGSLFSIPVNEAIANIEQVSVNLIYDVLKGVYSDTNYSNEFINRLNILV